MVNNKRIIVYGEDHVLLLALIKLSFFLVNPNKSVFDAIEISSGFPSINEITFFFVYVFIFVILLQLKYFEEKNNKKID